MNTVKSLAALAATAVIVGILAVTLLGRKDLPTPITQVTDEPVEGAGVPPEVPEVIVATDPSSQSASTVPNGSVAGDVSSPRWLLDLPFEDFQPDVLYTLYRDAAENGDQDAQFVLETIAAICARSGPNVVLQMEQQRVPEDAIARERVRESVCAPLVREVSDLQAVRSKYSQALRDSAYIASTPSRPNDREHWRSNLGAALAWDYPEEFLRGETYREIVRYYAQSDAPEDDLRREAWALMACRVEFECDSNAERGHLLTQLGPDAYRRIESIESELIVAESLGQWRDVGFPGGGPPGVPLPRTD